jgi:hypothetical protein
MKFSKILNPKSSVNKLGYVLLFCIVLWYLSPYIFLHTCKYKYSGEYYNLYSNDKIDKNLITRLYNSTTAKLMNCSAMNIDSADVVIINNKLLFNIMMPMNFNGLASNYLRFNIIIISKASVKENTTLSNFPLNALIVHEVVHSIVNQKVTISTKKIPLWINEGYAEHISFLDVKETELLEKYYKDKEYLNYLKRYRKDLNFNNVLELNNYLDIHFNK